MRMFLKALLCSSCVATISTLASSDALAQKSRKPKGSQQIETRKPFDPQRMWLDEALHEGKYGPHSFKTPLGEFEVWWHKKPSPKEDTAWDGQALYFIKTPAGTFWQYNKFEDNGQYRFLAHFIDLFSTENSVFLITRYRIFRYEPAPEEGFTPVYTTGQQARENIRKLTEGYYGVFQEYTSRKYDFRGVLDFSSDERWQLVPYPGSQHYTTKIWDFKKAQKNLDSLTLFFPKQDKTGKVTLTRQKEQLFSIEYDLMHKQFVDHGH